MSSFVRFILILTIILIILSYLSFLFIPIHNMPFVTASPVVSDISKVQQQIKYYFTFWGHIALLSIILISYIFNMSKNNPLFFAVYIIKWFIMIFGILGIYVHKDDIKKQLIKSDIFLFMLIIVHFIYLLPLLSRNDQHLMI